MFYLCLPYESNYLIKVGKTSGCAYFTEIYENNEIKDAI